MSGHVSDVRGSTEITVEPNLQLRFVMAPHTDVSIVANASLIAPFEEAEKRSQSHSVKNDQLSSATDCPTTDDDGRVATEDEVHNLLNYWATTPLQNYLQNAPGGEVPGALDLGQASASNVMNALMIGSYITPIPAAVVADSWLGRYKTMLYAAIIESIGATILFATSLPAAIHGGAALSGVIPACILLAVGSGAFKTTVVPFIADQYEQTEPRIHIKKTGEKVVTSRELTITYIYNAFYWAVNVVGFFADSTPLLEKYVGFWVAYLIPCCCMWLALIPILLGRNYFIRESPTGNIMPDVVSALRYGIAGGFQMDSAKPDVQLQHDRQVTWTDSFIEDIKRSLLTCRVLILFPIHWLCYNQTFNNLISQAGQMVTYGIPNDMIKITGAISGIVVAPMIQKGLYPFLTKKHISFSPIARMSVGFAVLTLSMVYTTIVQKLVYQTGSCYDTPLACPAALGRTVPNQVSVFLQTPIYFGGAVAEVLCLTTGTEYAYNHAPKRMKTLVQSIWLAMAGFGSCLALAFTPLTMDPHLVTMYAILSGLLGGATILL
ncbi:POT family-domain-containing protein [Daldinia vernicosa]|uniref:POT family-domain-containing protein n=1 Tax=Daldinia vernicosa TaxID=114800 RepID=UPI00200820C5|nr:POT family-domain-containing protein [Daldinia vernicosa]KAI0852293.1 POT family-domain-containing protein [Daldinia vernicosa]